jgi:acyl carrier protein
MKTPDSIRTTIRNFILTQFPAARERAISDHDRLLELGIVDSLGVLDIVAHLEAEFEIRIADDELEVADFESIEALADFVHRKLGCTSSP